MRVSTLNDFLGNRLHEYLAMALQFDLADARDLKEFLRVARASLTHLYERDITENYVWRHALFGRHLFTQIPQAIKELQFAGHEIDSRARRLRRV